MKIKVLGLAFLLGLATILGACENTDTPATDNPAVEPNDAPVVTPEPTANP